MNMRSRYVLARGLRTGEALPKTGLLVEFEISTPSALLPSDMAVRDLHLNAQSGDGVLTSEKGKIRRDVREITLLN